MFRNQYDSDNITWSPQGRLFQLEYACEAVKQGSCCVGVRSKTHAVLVTLKRSPSELGSYQQKIFGIDDHIAIAISGLCGDARVISRFLRTEAISYKYTFGSPIPVERLINKLSASKYFFYLFTYLYLYLNTLISIYLFNCCLIILIHLISYHK